MKKTMESNKPISTIFIAFVTIFCFGMIFSNEMKAHAEIKTGEYGLSVESNPGLRGAWSFETDTGVLTIIGGEIGEGDPEKKPWNNDDNFKNAIQKIEFDATTPPSVALNIASGGVKQPPLKHTLRRYFENMPSLEEVDMTNLKFQEPAEFEGLFQNTPNLKKVIWGSSITVTDLVRNMFSGCTSLETINLSDLSTSKVTDMAGLFENCTSLEEITFGDNFSTENVTAMHGMFKNTKALKTLDLTEFETDKVNSMMSMFEGSTIQTLTLPADFAKNTIDFTTMFKDSEITNFNNLKLNTDSATSITNMFENIKAEKIDLSSFDFSNVQSMAGLFRNNPNLKEIIVNAKTTNKLTDLSGMFNGSQNIQSVTFGNNFDTSSVTDMSYMFNKATAIKELDLSMFNTSSVETMNGMFFGATTLDTLDISSFDTQNVKKMASMFSNTNLANIDISHFNLENVTTMNAMFANNPNLRSCTIDATDTSSLTDTGSMFYKNPLLETIVFGQGFNTSKVTSMSGMFREASSIEKLDLSTFDLSKVTDMSLMFYKNSELIELTFDKMKSFSAINNLTFTFYGAEKLTNLDLSMFNTQNVTNMYGMFYNTKSLTDLTLGETFTTTNVTNMNNMFDGAAIQNLDLSHFDTNTKKPSMKSMLALKAGALKELKLGKNFLFSYNVFSNNSSLTSALPTNTTKARYFLINSEDPEDKYPKNSLSTFMTDFDNNPKDVTYRVLAEFKISYSIDDVPIESWILEGETMKAPEAPEKNGYGFDGWFADDQFETLFDFETGITGAATLYPKFSLLHTISYVANGGSEIAPQTIKDGATLKEPENPKKTGFEFDGWYTDTALTNLFDFTSKITDSMTLYAKWKTATPEEPVTPVNPSEPSTPVQKYKVTFNTNGGSEINPIEMVGSTFVKKPTDPIKAGYTFAGWYSDAELTQAYDFSKGVTTNLTLFAKWAAGETTNTNVYRLYNPNSGEHFYTTDSSERTFLISLGWKDEGLAWVSATDGAPVYRVYNPNSGDHHYTMDQAEKDNLIKAGWSDEGIGWYSADSTGIPIYRLYNPNATVGSHHYTTNSNEREMLISVGWSDENIGWYGLKAE